MIKVLLFDFSRVLLFPKDVAYTGSLNQKHKELSANAGYKIFDHFSLNNELLIFLQGLKDKYNLCLFTTETIQDSPEILPTLNKIFQKIYSGTKLGLSKRESKSYLVIAEDLNLSPEEILFIDDLDSNILAAKNAGLVAVCYISNEQIIQAIKTKLQI